MYHPNKCLSPELHVKEQMKPDEVVFFKLVNSDRVDLSRDDGKGTYLQPEVYRISDRITVTDPYAKGGPSKVVIGNVVGANPVTMPDNSTVMKEIVKGVEFFRGAAKVKTEDYATYCYLMRRPDCETNPFRKAMGGKKVLFRKVEEKKEINELLLLEDLAYQAQRVVRETKDPMKIKAMAAALNKSVDDKFHIGSYIPGVKEDLQPIKLELIQRAKQYPKQVIYASDDEEAKVKVQVMEAKNFGVIVYNEKAWWLMSSKMDKIMQPDADKDKVDQLVEFFVQEENEKIYNEFGILLTKATGGGRV